MIKIDRHTVIQILGSLMNKPELMSDVDRYIIEVGDFPNTLDKLIFSAINNLYNDGDGANKIKTVDIINYLNDNQVAKNLIEKENGETFIKDCEMNSEPANFNHYYNRLKKLNLLKDLEKTGRDITEFYCEDILNPNYVQINERFETLTVSDIINSLRLEVSRYEQKFELNSQIKERNASDGIEELIVSLKEAPEVGLTLQGDIFNTVSRGARKGKLYIRSAASGVGKTRRMIGDACFLAFPLRYDRKKGRWVETGHCEKVLYIMTEQSIKEIQTMILAYLTGYNEEIFLYGTYGEEEMPRIRKAVEIMKKFPNLETAEIPDPCSDAVKNLFRRYNIQHGVEHFFYDYIFSSPAMLNEYRDLKVREDVALRLFTTTLKNLAKELDVFTMTATQLTLTDEEAKKGGFKDEHCIRGSKAINDLSDLTSIMSRPTSEELSELSGFQSSFSFAPNLVTDVFKNRGGRWNRVRIWSYYDAGCLRTEDLFITTADMKSPKDFQIIELKEDSDADYTDMLNLLNTGEVTDELAEELFEDKEVNKVEMFEISPVKPEDIITDAAAAFDDYEDKKRRTENMSFDDLIGF